MNKICFYTNDPNKIKLTFVKLYGLDEKEENIEGFILTDTFYVFNDIVLDRLMTYVDIIQKNNKIISYKLDYNPFLKTTLKENETLIEFITYIKPVKNSQEIFIYIDKDNSIFFSKEILKNELSYFPLSFFVLKDINIFFKFEQNACFPSDKGVTLKECLEREKGTSPISLIFSRVDNNIEKMLFIVLCIFLVILYICRKYFSYKNTKS
jgi:hypothetical protein